MKLKYHYNLEIGQIRFYWMESSSNNTSTTTTPVQHTPQSVETSESNTESDGNAVKTQESSEEGKEGAYQTPIGDQEDEEYGGAEETLNSRIIYDRNDYLKSVAGEEVEDVQTVD